MLLTGEIILNPSHCHENAYKTTFPQILQKLLIACHNETTHAWIQSDLRDLITILIFTMSAFVPLIHRQLQSRVNQQQMNPEPSYFSSKCSLMRYLRRYFRKILLKCVILNHKSTFLTLHRLNVDFDFKTPEKIFFPIIHKAGSVLDLKVQKSTC